MALKSPNFWTRLNLAQQFAITSLIVLFTGMIIIGHWVSEKIAASVIQNTAVSAALYLNSFVAPEVQELANQDQLSIKTINALDRLYQKTPLHERVRSFKIWGMEGEILYSNNPQIIGRVFPVTPNKSQAWNGKVMAEFTGLDYAENVIERGMGVPLLEIYTPIRARWDNRIIAVAEFYDDATELTRHLSKARIESWLVVASVTLCIFILLFSIVRRGNRTIIGQQKELRARVQQLSSLLKQNNELHHRVRRATERAVELNERYLHRLGTELHDGPAQILGYGLLRLDSFVAPIQTCECGKAHSANVEQNTIDNFRDALSEALQEIRNLSTGLAVPEMSALNSREAIEHVITTHKRRTGSPTALSITTIPDNLSLSLKINIYRFLQEALNNAFQHAAGQQQSVYIDCKDNILNVEVSDNGPGFDPIAVISNNENRLGLSSMRERIESLGGQFYIESSPGKGTRVRAQLFLGPMANAYA